MNTKVYSLKELKVKAQKRFENQGINKLYATSDGQFFILENRARLHANMNKLTVHVLENENPSLHVAEAKEASEAKATLSVKEITAAAKASESLDELKQMLMDEIAGPNRSSAVKAIQERISKLTA